MIEATVYIVMPVYNREKTLANSVQSILEQTYSNWILTIVNDSSTDNSETVIDRLMLQDKRIRKKTNTEYSHSCAGARLSGLMDSSGDYIAFLDSDDTWPEYHLSEFVEYLESNQDVDYVFGDIKRVNQQNETIVESKFKTELGLPSKLQIKWNGKWGKIASEGAVKTAMQSRFNSGMHTAVFRANFFKKVPLRDVYGCEDALLTLEALSKNITIAICNKIHLHYLIHEDNVSSVGSNMTFEHVEKNSLSEVEFYKNLIPKFVHLNEAEDRERKIKLADLYVWYLGYNTYSKFGQHSKALPFILKGIKIRPFNYNYYITFISTLIKTLINYKGMA